MEWINGGAHSLCSDVTVSAVENNLGESRVAEIAADKKIEGSTNNNGLYALTVTYYSVLTSYICVKRWSEDRNFGQTRQVNR